MTELLIASAVTALVTGAAATLTSAVSNAATQTRDIRGTRSAGQYALNRIGRTIREARGIGQVTATAVTLWQNDANGDDVLNLYEAAVIRYDSANRQIIYEYMESAGATPGTLLSTANFKNVGSVQTSMNTADRKSVVWAEDVESFTLTGYPNYTDTRIVEATFTLGVDDDALDFRVAASPRASADYLLANDSSVRDDPPPGSARKVRKKVSKWNGLTAIEMGNMDLN